jgi:hypothetical protein
LLSIPADSDFIFTGTFDSDLIVVETFKTLVCLLLLFNIITTTLGDHTHGLVVLVVLSAPLEIYNRLLFDRFDRCCCRTAAVADADAVADAVATYSYRLMRLQLQMRTLLLLQMRLQTRMLLLLQNADAVAIADAVAVADADDAVIIHRYCYSRRSS